MELALEVFETTNAYDGAIADFLFDQIQAAHPHEHGEGCGCGCEDTEARASSRPSARCTCRSSRTCATARTRISRPSFYRVDEFAHEHSLVNAQQLNGKELSYNNILDTDACWSLVREFDEPAVIILKHQNPCGSATAADHRRGLRQARSRATRRAPSAASSRPTAPVTLEMVEHINENKQFVEVLIAPEFESAALELLQQKKNLRVLRTGGVDAAGGRGGPLG